MIVEIIVVVLIVVFFYVLFLSLHNKLKHRNLIKNYNLDNDLSRKGEQRKRELRAEDAVRKSANSVSPARYKPLPTTPVVKSLEDSSGDGKAGSGSRGFFGLIRRKK